MFCVPVSPVACLDVAGELVGFQIVEESAVDKSLHQFPKTAEEADGSVVGLLPFLFAFLEDGYNHSLFQLVRKLACLP